MCIFIYNACILECIQYTYIDIISYIIYVLLYTFRIQVERIIFQIAGYLDIGKIRGLF